MGSTKERRKIPRMEASYQVFMTSAGTIADCNTFDISFYGIGLNCDTSIDPGSRVDLSIVVKDANMSFRVSGLVCYCTSCNGNGKPATYKTIGYVASNGLVHKAVCDIVNSF